VLAVLSSTPDEAARVQHLISALMDAHMAAAAAGSEGNQGPDDKEPSHVVSELIDMQHNQEHMSTQSHVYLVSAGESAAGPSCS
jgi:hypothetical protein